MSSCTTTAQEPMWALAAQPTLMLFRSPRSTAPYQTETCNRHTMWADSERSHHVDHRLPASMRLPTALSASADLRAPEWQVATTPGSQLHSSHFAACFAASAHCRGSDAAAECSLRPRAHLLVEVNVAHHHGIGSHPGVGRQRGHAVAQDEDLPLPANAVGDRGERERRLPPPARFSPAPNPASRPDNPATTVIAGTRLL